MADLLRVTDGRADPELAELLIGRSYDTACWMARRGIEMEPAVSLSAVKVGNTIKWSPGAVIRAKHEGVGLSAMWFRAAEREGVEVRYDTAVVRLLQDQRGRVTGVVASGPEGFGELSAKAVVLGCGGFEANPEWRTRYLGPGWELAKVRGTRFNMGDGLKMALDIGACPYGNWSGRHAVSWERYAPEFGDLNLPESSYRHSYPLSIMVNASGRRFVDEGAEFYNYTYAKYGAEVLKQPAQFAYQVFDARVKHLLRPEYGDRRVTRVVAGTLEELASRLEGVNPEGFLKTVRAFNAAVRADIPFNHSIKDGRRTIGIEPPKSNWANPLDTPPFEAYAVTCGITFTFGGLRVEPQSGQVLDVNLRPIAGLYTAGEMLGGLFYFNYPAGTGLVSGAVFGRIAGAGAASEAQTRNAE
jgi:tricarballylate dehydrogenase